MNIALPVMGGLGLLLYGMNLMSAALQKTAGSRLKKILGVLTTNRFMAVLVGALVTMIIQSSGATTVMIIGFVNAGLMTLPQAAGVIMGANIGTTITAQLIAFNLSSYAPIAIFVGVAIWMMSSKKKTKDIAEIIIGIGILFIGMGMMGDGLKPLAQLPAFTEIMTKLSNPILGMLVGFGLTTLVQSSSASIGLLQALAGQGLVGMNIAFPVLFGENIGSTTTALISSVGANKTAKKAALIHFLFNLVGTILFMTLLRAPIEILVTKISPGNVQRQIANAHTFFNLINVIIQFPFINLLVKLVDKIVTGEDVKDQTASKYLDYRIMETPSIALGQANKEVVRMGEIVIDNLIAVRHAFVDNKFENIEGVFDKEQTINKLQKEISNYLVELSNTSLSEELHKEVNVLFNIVGDIERVGDHIENIVELAQEKQADGYLFSEQAVDELNEMFSLCEKAFSTSILAFRDTNESYARQVIGLEDEVDRLESQNRTNHIERLNKMQCETGPGVIFLDSISNLERMSDHSLNIAMYVLDKFK